MRQAFQFVHEAISLVLRADHPRSDSSRLPVKIRRWFSPAHCENPRLPLATMQSF